VGGFLNVAYNKAVADRLYAGDVIWNVLENKINKLYKQQWACWKNCTYYRM